MIGGGALAKMEGGTVARALTITERLQDRKRSLEEQLAQTNRALEGLEKNPEIANVVNEISKIYW